MKMPLRKPLPGKPGSPGIIITLILVSVIISGVMVSAANTTGPGLLVCSKYDQFGNPVCQVTQAPQTSSNTDGYVPEDGKIQAGNSPSVNIPFLSQQLPLLKEFLSRFDTISMQGVQGSINQTLHSGNYTYFTGKPADNRTIPPGEINATRPGALVLATLSGIRQFQEISTLAMFRTARVFPTKNVSIWTNRTSDDLIGSPLSGTVPDENYLSSLDTGPVKAVPITNPQVIPPRIVPQVRPQPVVQPTLHPEPVPVFNVSVDTDPKDALVVLNGNRTGMTPLVMTGIPRGTYTLNLTHNGYVPYGEVFTLDADKTIAIPLTSELEAKFPKAGTSTAPNVYGGLYITSFPSNLDLALDGLAVKGGTPFLIYGLPEGFHTVSITRNDKQYGAVTYTRQVWVYKDDLVKTEIDTETTRVIKEVSISSSSYPGAEYTINGQYPPGRVPATVNIEMPGSFVSIRSGDTYTSTLVPMLNLPTTEVLVNKPDHPHAPILVDSKPGGADIFIDGFRTGHVTPYTFNEVSAGLHRIGVSLAGYYPNEEIVTVPIQEADSATQKVFFMLENYGEGTIVVDSMPAGASIYLNGWPTGELTPHTFDHLKIGFYEVAVTQGGKPWIQQLELIPQSSQKVVADFNIFY